eukprot:SAG22_NODE_70_length_22717_cov_12.413741_2_plen_64_part_00
MGSYAASVGCLLTYQSQQLSPGTALISDEQLHPRRSNYHGLYNFWCVHAGSCCRPRTLCCWDR